jgi:four helix bundle protein
MKNYKDLIVWKKAHLLVLYVYKSTVDFPKSEQFNLTSQLRRAATSIPANVAEGCGKFSQSDFANFLQIGLGSANEVEYLALLANELGFLKSDQHQILDSQVNEVRAMLISLITKVRKDSKIQI